MAKFTFEGFPSGASVAVSATQAGITVSAETTSWGQSMATIGITTTRSSEMVAPYGVILEAAGHAGFTRNGPAGDEVFDPTWQDFFYVWTALKSDGAGGWLEGQIALKDESGALNIPDAWRDLNVMYGPRAAFVFRDPGTWKVTLWCVEMASGIPAEAETQEFVVADPDLAYQGARTAVFSNAGDFTGAPAGAVQCTSLAQLTAWLNGQGASGRMLFRRGETTDIAAAGGTIDAQSYAGWRNLRTGAFGSGARPAFTGGTLFRVGFNTGTSTGDFVFQDLRMLGGWDASREAGRPVSLHEWKHWVFEVEPFVVYDNLDLGCGLYPFGAYQEAKGNGILYDSHIHDWGDTYGVYPEGRSMTVVGSAVHQNADACLGSMQAPFRNYGAAYRDTGDTRDSDPALKPRRTVLAASSFFNNVGWSGWSWNGIAASQSPLRLGTAGVRDTRINLDRVVAEGGFTVISNIDNIGAGSGSVANPMNMVVDKLLAVTAATLQDVLFTWQSGGTWRNVLAISADVDTPRDVTKTALRAEMPVNRAADFEGSPFRAYNWTVLNFSSKYAITPFQIAAGFTDVTLVNNVEHDPQGGQDAAALIDLTGAIAGFAPRSKGIRFSVEKPVVANTSLAGNAAIDVPWPAQNYLDPAEDTGKTRQLANTDFDADDIHAVFCNEGIFHAAQGELSLDVSDPAKAVVTNTSGVTWTGNLTVNLVPRPGSLAATTDTAFATPALVPGAAPMGNPAALEAGATPVAWDSLLAPGARRPSPASSGAAEG